ncbi:MAG: 4Fe-4S binding protein, partial [Paraclostridium sp.]
ALNGGAKSCRYGCLGLGTCVNACNFDAIKIIDGVAIIDEDKCVMCGKCIDVCPKGVISKKPIKNKVVIECNSKDFGKAVKDTCTVGCIGCGICAKSCPFEAIEMDGKLAKVHYDKCVQCMVCVEKCPTKSIKGNVNDRKKVTIEEDKCIGCTICKKQCKFDAIEGELKQKHKVDINKCVGCHVCVQKCPKKAIKIL